MDNIIQSVSGSSGLESWCRSLILLGHLTPPQGRSNFCLAPLLYSVVLLAGVVIPDHFCYLVWIYKSWLNQNFLKFILLDFDNPWIWNLICFLSLNSLKCSKPRLNKNITLLTWSEKAAKFRYHSDRKVLFYFPKKNLFF